MIGLAVAVYIALGVVALIILPDRLLENWFPTLSFEERAAYLGPAAQVVLFGLGGIIAVAGVGLSLARHLEELRSAELDRERLSLDRLRSELQEKAHVFDRKREKNRLLEVRTDRVAESERELRARFVTAVDLLTAVGAIKRTAGLYALAALADDWLDADRSEETQVCIDVLCGYLRAPFIVRDDGQEESEVRLSGYSILRSRLTRRHSDAPRWSGRTFNLSGAPMTFDVALSGLVLTSGTRMNLSGVRLGRTHTLFLDGLIVEDNSSLTAGGIRLRGQSAIRLRRMKLSGNARVRVSNLQMKDEAAVTTLGSTVGGSSQLSFTGLSLSDGGRLSMFRNVISGSANVSVSGDMAGRSRLSAVSMRTEGSALVSLEQVTVAEESEIGLTMLRVSDSAQMQLKGAVVTSGGLRADSGFRLNEAGVRIAETATAYEEGVRLGRLATVDSRGLVESHGDDSGDELEDD